MVNKTFCAVNVPAFRLDTPLSTFNDFVVAYNTLVYRTFVYHAFFNHISLFFFQIITRPPIVSIFSAISTRHFVYKFFEIWNKVNNVSIFCISLFTGAPFGTSAYGATVGRSPSRKPPSRRVDLYQLSFKKREQNFGSTFEKGGFPRLGGAKQIRGFTGASLRDPWRAKF
jgi:hypothetical protein